MQKKTKLEDNPKLFDVAEATSKSTKGVVKSLGLAIRKVYLTPEENPDTEEWLEIRKKAWEKKIQVFEQTYYGQHKFWYLAVDNESERRNLWRNTPEKIQTLMEETSYGRFGDYHNWEGLLLTPDAAEAITKLGWELVYPQRK